MAGLISGLISGLTAVGCSELPEAASGAVSTQPVAIVASAAASLQEVLEAIAPQFQAAHSEIIVDYNFGSSGALQQQIKQGAPVDIFFSAATQQMDALADRGLILPDSRQNVVSNSLVLIAPKASTLSLTRLTELKAASITHFAVGEFRSVPAGQYAKQVLTHMNLLEALQPKLVFGNSVRSVLSAVESGNAELGLVYATDAALSDRVKVLATVPPDAHQPIVYPIAIVQSSQHPEAAQHFINFLSTAAVQIKFAEFGFGPAHLNSPDVSA